MLEMNQSIKRKGLLGLTIWESLVRYRLLQWLWDEAALTAAVCGDKTHRGRNAEEKREKGAAVLRLL